MKEKFPGTPRPVSEAEKQNEQEVAKENEISDERIEQNILRPSVFDQYADTVGVAVSTKALNQTQGTALRILGKKDRFTGPLAERLRAGRMLAKLRNSIDPSIDLHHVVKAQLAHTGNIFKVDEEYIADLTKGNLSNKQIERTDGLITNLKGYPLYVSAADCYPICIYDVKGEAIGLFHSGRRGFLAGIIGNGLQAMQNAYGTRFADVRVYVGPGISNQYVVSKKELEEYAAAHPEFVMEKYIMEVPGEPEKVTFDLQQAIGDELIRLGVPQEQIQLSGFHTDTSNELFSSERIEGSATRDSFGTLMVLKKKTPA